MMVDSSARIRFIFINSLFYLFRWGKFHVRKFKTKLNSKKSEKMKTQLKQIDSSTLGLSKRTQVAEGKDVIII